MLFNPRLFFCAFYTSPQNTPVFFPKTIFWQIVRIIGLPEKTSSKNCHMRLYLILLCRHKKRLPAFDFICTKVHLTAVSCRHTKSIVPAFDSIYTKVHLTAVSCQHTKSIVPAFDSICAKTHLTAEQRARRWCAARD